MTTEQQQFAIDLADKASSHEQWLAIVRFGLGTLINNQPLLAEIICREAQCEAEKSHASHVAADHIAGILSELNLRIAPDAGAENGEKTE